MSTDQIIEQIRALDREFARLSASCAPFDDIMAVLHRKVELSRQLQARDRPPAQ